MAHQVFICYSSKDKPIADAACAALEAQRIRCWIAPRDIIPGEEYAKSIIEALSICQVVVLIFSKTANDSPQVHREIERAVSKGKIILPFRIEDTLPSYAMEFAISNAHWLDAMTPPMERRLAELCDSIGHLLKRHHTAASPPAAEPAAKASATENAATSPPPPPPTPSAYLSLVARPKINMGFLNSVDVLNAIVVNIDGKEEEMRWGQRIFDLKPGPHRLIVTVRNVMFPAIKHPSELQVNLRAGEITHLRYTAGINAGMRGTLEIDPQPKAVFVPQAPTAELNTRPCRSCNRTMPATGDFCPACGQKQS